MATTDGPFEPRASYDPDGDCIEFLAAPDSFYAERIDGLVTVYRSQKTDDIIGSLIKGARALCSRLSQTLPGLGIEIRDGSVRLRCLFQAELWTRPPGKITVLTYQKLIQVARDVPVEGAEALATS